MEEKITMKIGGKEFQNMLESYYQEKTNDPSIKINIGTSTRLVGLHEDKETCVNVKLTRQISICGTPATLEESLDKKDVTEAMREIMQDPNYEIKNITYQTCDSDSYYYFLADKKFAGVTIELKRKQMKKVLDY